MALAAPLPLRAGSFVWTGLTFNDDWETDANWRGAVAPPNDGSADITLGPAVNVYGGYTYLYLGTNQNINSLSFTGAFTPYDIWGGGEGNKTLTIQSGLTYSPSSPVDTWLESSLNLDLAGNQTWNITNGSLEIDGSISGNVTLTKSGTGELRLFGDSTSSTFSGTIVLNEGGLLLGNDGALGAGTLVINGGSVPYLATADCYSVTVGNAVTLNGGSFQTLLKSPLTLSGTVTLNGNSTIEPQTHEPLYLSGNVTGSYSLTIAGPGVVALTGVGTYTGGTNVSDGVLIFGAGSSIPTSGLLESTGDGYIGIATPPDSLQSSFIDKFDKANTTGTIGFDTGPDSDVSTFNGDIDLSSIPTGTAFNSAARLGSATQAILTGTITPSDATTLSRTIYNFGGGGGLLEIRSQLTDTYIDDILTPRSVVVNSPAAAPLTLRLNPGTESPNSYSGGTTATQSAVIFGPGGLPSGGTADLHLGPGGYIGLEDVNSDNLTSYLARFPANTSQGIIGFDTGPCSDEVTIGNVNLMTFGDSTFYLGTATSATINGTISLPSIANAYRFAGYKGGQLEIDSSLGNNMGTITTSVIIGDPDVPATFNDPTQATNPGVLSTVILAGNNTYSGGTTLNAGRLVVGQSNDSSTTDALGTGALTVQPVNFTHDSSLRPRVVVCNNGITIPNDVVLNTDLEVGGDDDYDNDFELAGAISGGGGLFKLGDSTLTLSGNNTFSGGIQIGSRDNYGGTVVFNASNAAGSGILTINSGEAEFTGNDPVSPGHPVIGGLAGRDVGDPLVLDSVPSEAGPGVIDLTINQNSDTHYYGYIDGGSAALIKDGSGSLFLENENSYSGGTTINTGALVAGNDYALGSGTITLSGGKLGLEYDVTLGNSLVLTSGTLGGFGTFAPPSRPAIGANMIVAPGSIDVTAPGTLSFGSSGLTFAADGTYRWQLQSVSAGAGIGWDLINVAGQLNVTATPGVASPFTIELYSLDANGAHGLVGDFNSNQSYTWMIASADGGITNFDASDFTLDSTSSFLNYPNGGTFSLSLGGDSTELFLNFTPVPEPSTYALLSLGLTGLLLRRLRRRR